MSRVLFATRRSAGIVLLAAMIAAPFSGAAASSDTIEVTEAKLQAVARAFIQVVDIHESYLPRIQAAASPEEARNLEREAAGAMIVAIEGTEGVTVREYDAILQAASQDEGLRAALLARIEREARRLPARKPA